MTKPRSRRILGFRQEANDAIDEVIRRVASGPNAPKPHPPSRSVAKRQAVQRASKPPCGLCADGYPDDVAIFTERLGPRRPGELRIGVTVYCKCGRPLAVFDAATYWVSRP